jgi:DNA-binding LacI/PurR family transcriptional regulator
MRVSPDKRSLDGRKAMAHLVSVSQVPKTIAYINNQKEHHRKKTFEEEFLELLTKHGIEYDQRHVF